MRIIGPTLFRWRIDIDTSNRNKYKEGSMDVADRVSFDMGIILQAYHQLMVF